MGENMNVLYISNLTGNLFAGPNNSVPAQIKAQSKRDNVFWYNINDIKREEWKEINCYNLKDYPSGRLKDLPKPFNKPDIAVIEEFYCFPFCKIIKDINENNIPYIIIPRSELTKKAQKRKRVKKFIGNICYFKKMANNASAIQFLSKQEKVDSGDKWNKNDFIISNGISIPEEKRENFSKDKIRATYIGRYEIYQKGLDILLDAVSDLQNNLRAANFVLNMYGVNQEETVKIIEKKITENNINDLVIINDAVYAEKKKEILLNTDVFVLTSRFEGMPMGVIEALSYGVPCLVTKGTNMADDIKEFDAGWTCDTSKEELIEAIKQVLSQKEELSKLGKNARELSNKYSWKKIAEESHSEFEKILEKVK